MYMYMYGIQIYAGDLIQVYVIIFPTASLMILTTFHGVANDDIHNHQKILTNQTNYIKHTYIKFNG